MSNRLSSTMLRTGSKRPNSFTKSQITFLRSELTRILPELPRDGTTTKTSVAKRLQQSVAKTIKSWSTGTPKPTWEVQQAIRGIKKVTRRNVETLYDGLDVKLTSGRKWQDYFGHGVKLPSPRVTPGKLPRFSETDPTTTRDAIVNAANNTEALRNMITDLTTKVDSLTAMVEELSESMLDVEDAVDQVVDATEALDKEPWKPVPGLPAVSTPTIWFGTPGNMQSFPVNDINTQFTMQIPEGMNADIRTAPTTDRSPARVEIASRSTADQLGGTPTEGQSEVS